MCKIQSVLSLIGKTPLLSLAPYYPGKIYAKLELLNPGGSIKDRIALQMLQTAIQNGELKPGMEILEATSGNTGIALALVGRALGYPVTIVMPENMSEERKAIIRALGARLILTDAKQSIAGAVCQAEILAKSGHYYMPKQFDNPQNAKAQQATALEILDVLVKSPDIFVSGIGSGGTLQGMAEVFLAANPNCQIIAVEPFGASVFQKEKARLHAIQGIGDGFLPANLNPKIINECMNVKDQEAIDSALSIAKQTGLLVGISSGANLWGALQAVEKYGKEKTIVTVFPDRGERYFSTGMYQTPVS